MGRIAKYEEIVLPILIQREDTRGDDKKLYYHVLQKLGFDTSVPLSMFLFNPEYPNWESITRVRRRLQEQHPELIPENVKKRREDAEDDFLEYVGSNT